MADIEWEASRKLDSLSNLEVEETVFTERVLKLSSTGRPVKLHLASGLVPRSDFINIDKNFGGIEVVRSFFEQSPKDYINFPFAERPWPIPDASVDYIYHEDFFEHICQREQFLVLAEAFRVMKPGSIHRINTPCLRAAMKRSDFTRGFSGVFVEEWDRWGHVALVTRASLEEMALMVGYRQVYFTPKHGSVSPHSVPDTRPGNDRDDIGGDISGNIFADLLK